MYYRTDELEQSIPETFPRSPKELSALARELGGKLQVHRQSYKAYGPYWWTVKAFLKAMSGLRQAWFCKSGLDGELAGHTPRPFRNDRQDLLQLWAALRYAAPACHDSLPEIPGELHVIELPGEGPALYRLQDADAVCQLDLFDEPDAPGPGQPVQDMVPQIAALWRRVGDQALAGDDMDRSVWAYRRMLAASRTSQDLAESWLRLAECFQHFNHIEKSVFCYECLMEHDPANWIVGEIGKIYLEAGRFSKAFDYYQKAVRCMPNNPEIAWGYQKTLENLQRGSCLDLARA